MAGKLVALAEAAQMLGITVEQLNELRERGDIHAYRDGGSWKFKSEEVERVADELKSGDLSLDDAGDSMLGLGDEPKLPGADSILLSEIELGESGPSSTVIGRSPDGGPASDVRLADGDESDLQFSADSGISLGDPSGMQLMSGDSGEQLLEKPAPKKPAGGDSSALNDLNLDLDLGGSALQGGSALMGAGSSKKMPAGGDSAVELAADEDDEMVLGEGSGSDLTRGGDSGIQLVDPADSGLSLEDAPLELGGSSVESLELGEDEEISLQEEVDVEAATQLKADDDFLLTPLDDGSSEEAEDSGSQVIALDSESFDESANTLLGAGMGLGAASAADELGGAGGMSVTGFGAATALGFPAGPAIPEAPWTAWNLATLVCCFLLLALTGMMMFDLIANIWTFTGVSNGSSSLMDAVLNAFPFLKP